MARRVGAGEEWKGQIDRQLAEADIILLLVSASVGCRRELCAANGTVASKRRGADNTLVLPVMAMRVGTEMANEEDLARLRQVVVAWNVWRINRGVIEEIPTGAAAWNAWRGQNSERYVDLQRADLVYALLAEADLRGADLRNANLFSADLTHANLAGAILRGTQLLGANLAGALLENAILTGANLTDADLTGCHIYGIAAWNLKLEGAK